MSTAPSSSIGGSSWFDLCTRERRRPAGDTIMLADHWGVSGRSGSMTRPVGHHLDPTPRSKTEPPHTGGGLSGHGREMIYQAGSWQLHVGRRELRAGGIPIAIGGRAFEIMEILVRSANELITKDELMNRIWPGASIGENALQVHISAIRKALGQDRGMLKTVSGRGYRLVGSWIARHQDQAGAEAVAARMRGPGATPTNNLPTSMTQLIGRCAVALQVRELASTDRMVTLTGPGGIGKTSLALHVARGIVGDFADGVWLVELASQSDSAGAPTETARALGLPNGPDSVTPDAIAGAIGCKKLLLVLDNCEHLAGAVASLAETLLALCPHTTIVATSREILRVQGECVYRVPPLDVPADEQDEADHILNYSAVELFIARTKAFDTGFSPRPDELADVAAICRRLDGIPLAIEFAAAHAATFGIQRAAAGLDNRFMSLTHGRRTAPLRHRTLRAVFDWSYDILPEAEQILLRHLAIFPADFTLGAAAAVLSDQVADPAAIMDGIANLVAKSLVVLDTNPAPRWCLLETIRAYALDILVRRDEAESAVRRHAAYCRDLVLPAAPVVEIC